jgi:hypothetical protein
MDDDRQILTRLYWWSFAARVLAGLLAWYLTVYVKMPFLEDGLFYDEWSVDIAKEWLAGDSSPALQYAREKKWPWPLMVFIASIYYLTGGERMTPLVIILYSLLTAWTPVLTYRIGIQLGAPERGARLGAWLVVFSPAFAFWSGGLYKEGMILVALNLGIYHLLCLQERWSLLSIVLLVLSVLALYGLRFYLALIVVVIFLMGLLLGRFRSPDPDETVRILLRQMALATVFVLGLVAAGFTDQAKEMLPGDLAEGLEDMTVRRKDLAESAESGFGAEVSIRTPAEAIQQLPFGWLYFMTAPWLWQFGSLRQSLTIPETLVWVLLTIPIVVGIREGLRRNMPGTFSLLVAIVAISCFYALWVSNIGTVYRLRIQVWILLAVFAGWGWVVMRGEEEMDEDYLDG